MRPSLLKIICMFSFISLTGCSSISNPKNILAVYPVAVPVQIEYQDEIKLLRINQLLNDQKQLSKKDKAILYYERGSLYDKMGLVAHSRFDFSQAININPEFMEAYDPTGLFLLLGRSYDEAFEAFDSSIELSEKSKLNNSQYSYLYLSIGLVKSRRFDLAKYNIDKFYAFDKTDPLRMLWRYIINSNIDKEEALIDLKKAQKNINKQDVNFKIIDVVLGDISEYSLLANITSGVKTNKELAQRLCEVYFYLGKWHQIENHFDKASYYFRLSTATNIHEFIEYKFALVELAEMQEFLHNKAQKLKELPKS